MGLSEALTRYHQRRAQYVVRAQREYEAVHVPSLHPMLEAFEPWLMAGRSMPEELVLAYQHAKVASFTQTADVVEPLCQHALELHRLWQQGAPIEWGEAWL